MAKLKSIVEENYLEIKPSKLGNRTSEGYQWVNSNIRLFLDGNLIANEIGTYFDLGEIVMLVVNIRDLLEKKSESAESNFLEPNLELKINKTDAMKYSVNVIFRKSINYEDGKLKDSDNTSKKLNYLTDQSLVLNFIKELESELNILGRNMSKSF